MHLKKELSTLLLLGSGLMVSAPAMAVQSCWDVPDFVGCAIQCAVMGVGNAPCPVDAARVRMDVDLPDVNSSQYQKVKKTLVAQTNASGFGEKRNGIIKHNLKQTCSSSEMLDVVGKIGLSNPDALVEKCFIKDVKIKDVKEARSLTLK